MRLFIQYCGLIVLLFGFVSLSYGDEFDEPTSLSPKNKLIILQTELTRYEVAAQKPWLQITKQTKMKIGKRYANVPALRERLEAIGDLTLQYAVDPTFFDPTLREAIKRFQTRHGLKADGILGKDTITQLNVSPQVRIHAIQVNMQRWQEFSKKLGDRYIMVNIPDYQMYLYEDGKPVLTMRAVVGKPDLQTPELTSKITRIVLNPYWNVPNKIAANDLLPKVQADPYYLADMHINVYIRDDERSGQLAQNDIDWERVKDTDNSIYHFRQEPGEGNALGLVKFEFPNEYDVYLHDTPAKTLFENPLRALSHGCVRLEKPFDLVSYLMKDSADWSEERTQAVLDNHKTTYVPIARPIPIYITYLTVWADEAGVVNYRDDIYQRDTETNM